MIVFNLPALVICVIAFGAGFGINAIVGGQGEGLAMIVAGPIAAALDLVWRKKNGGAWFRPSGGGNLFWIPVWMFGALWLVLGIVYAARG